MTDELGEKPVPNRVLSVTSVVVLANMIALFAGLLVILDRYEDNASSETLVQGDIWGPFLLLLWGLGVANGLALVPWPRTRRLGLGVLAGTVAAVAAYYVWIFGFVLPGLGRQLG